MRRFYIILLVSFAISCTLDKPASNSLSPFPDLEKREGVFYEQGAEKPFTGVSESTYSNGNPYVSAFFKDGKFHGTYTAWHLNGQKMGESNYINGMKEGVSTAWHENGTKASEVSFKNNLREGKLEIYYPNGQLNAEAFFTADTLDSTNTRWDMEGNIVSVEVYENGELVEE